MNDYYYINSNIYNTNKQCNSYKVKLTRNVQNIMSARKNEKPLSNE